MAPRLFSNYKSFAEVGKAMHGFYQTDDRDMSSNANSYIACSTEGVSDVGMWIGGGQSCTLVNTVCEGNRAGLYLTGDNHGVYGAHFEKNRGYDLRVKSSRGTALVNITATGLVETAGPNTSSIFISGRMRDITIGEGTKHAVLSNVCVILGGIITDNGTGTVRMGITNSRGHRLRSRYPGPVQWLAETVTLDGGVDYATDGAWTELDITSATSLEARFVFLQLRHKKTCRAGDTLRLRRKGDTPQVPVECIAPAKRRPFVASAFCALDAAQVLEYFATDASDTEITVLGYIEGAPGGAVDEQAWLWVNGAEAGEHTCKSESLAPESMWAKSFFLEVTPHIRYGAPNQFSVRVHNDGAMGGVWQPVYLFTSDEPLTLDEIKKPANRQDEKLLRISDGK